MTTADGEGGAPDFEDFYRSGRDACLRAVLAATLDVDHAEECTAEAFARALQHWPQVRRHPAPEAWVVRTATNLHRDRYRRWRRLRRLLPALATADVAAAPELAVDPGLMAALRRLPRRQREVIALRVLIGLSGQETATTLGISTGSVGVHLHRGLATLRSHLAPRAAGDPLPTNTYQEALP